MAEKSAKNLRQMRPAVQLRVQRTKSQNDNRMSYNDVKSPGAATIEELVQCGICLDTLTNPRMLPCQHTFCLQCLKNVVCNKPLSTESLSCPLCDLKMPLEKGAESLEKLQRNLYIDSMLNLMNSGTPSPSKVQVSLDRRCTNCQSILEMRDLSCKHCKQPFCKVCLVEHAGKLIAKLPGFIQQLEDSENRLEHRIEIFDGRFDQLKASIESATEAKIAQIKAKEELALKEVQKIIDEEKEASESLKKKINDAKMSIANTDAEMVENTEKVHLFMVLHSRTEKLLDAVSHWGEVNVIFDAENFKLDMDECNSAEEDESVQSNIVIAKNPLENVETLTAYYQTHHFIPKFVWNKCPRPTGVGIPPWAEHLLYIAASETKQVLILDRNTNKVIERLSSESMLCPLKLAFNEKRYETYVTDKYKHCIHVFSRGGEYLRSLCSRGTSENKLISPEGIAIGPEDELIVCDTGNSRVVILNPDTGKQIATLGKNKKKTEFEVPTSVAYYQGAVIVADNGANRIKIYKFSGEKVMEFGSMGKNRGQFRSPETVAVDPLGFILVGDCSNARVQIFTPQGDLIRVFGGLGQEPGKFHWISGITVTKNLEIITTDHKKKSVQIF